MGPVQQRQRLQPCWASAGRKTSAAGLAARFWLESTLWRDVGTVGRGGALLRPPLDGEPDRPLRRGAHGPRLQPDLLERRGLRSRSAWSAPARSLIAQTIGSALPTLTLNRGYYARKANSVGYFLPRQPGRLLRPGDVRVQRERQLAAAAGRSRPTANNSRTGDYVGHACGYANGPLDVAVAYGSSTVADNYHFGSTTNVTTANLGASYDFDLVKLFGEYSKVDVKTDFVEPAPPSRSRRR